MAMSAAATSPANGLTVAIRKSFSSSGQAPFVLDVQFSAAPGITILYGASGAGKTTLLDCVAGLLTPGEGRIASGEAVWFDSASGLALPPNRRLAGYLLQTLALFPHMTVRQNVQYGLAALPGEQREARSREILESFRISQLAERRPSEISGGERQRVALARALVTRPRVLLLDEPLAALDAVTKARIVDDLRAWNAKQNIPILYVTHQREEVFALGESVIVLDAGRVIAQGPPHEVLGRPTSETVAHLAGFENVFQCTILAQHPELGTMTCSIAGAELWIEAPLARLDVKQSVQVGIRAGDILLAVAPLQGLSARNVFEGTIRSLEQRDVHVAATVDCGPLFHVQLTLGACKSLNLQCGMRVWLIIKTYSCHLLQ